VQGYVLPAARRPWTCRHPLLVASRQGRWRGDTVAVNPPPPAPLPGRPHFIVRWNPGTARGDRGDFVPPWVSSQSPRWSLAIFPGPSRADKIISLRHPLAVVDQEDENNGGMVCLLTDWG
jgi:hypothetical protein